VRAQVSTGTDATLEEKLQAVGQVERARLEELVAAA
jgi:hypothetical protein